MIIGDKSGFAIEIEFEQIDRIDWGYSRLWINDQPMGDFEDRNIMYPFVNGLHVDRLRVQRGDLPAFRLDLEPNLEAVYEIFASYDLYEINFDRLIDGPYDEAAATQTLHWLAAGENFDKTINSMFLYEGEIHVLWKETFYDWENRPPGALHYGKIAVNDFITVIEKLEELMQYEFRDDF